MVQLSSNNFGSLSALSNLTKLFFLEALNCGISDVTPISALPSLQYLYVAINPISDVAPLANLTGLRSIYLDFCQISDVSAFSGLVNLQTLSLPSNQIEDIAPLLDNTGLGSGDAVNLGSNPLSQQSIDVYIPALQARGVTVTY
jgi:Leucine-rich repeat (LRR) protein